MQIVLTIFKFSVVPSVYAKMEVQLKENQLKVQEKWAVPHATNRPVLTFEETKHSKSTYGAFIMSNEMTGDMIIPMSNN